MQAHLSIVKPTTPAEFVPLPTGIECFPSPAGAHARLRNFDPRAHLRLVAGGVEEQAIETAAGDEARAFRVVVREGAVQQPLFLTLVRVGTVVSFRTTPGEAYRSSAPTYLSDRVIALFDGNSDPAA